MTEKNHSVLFNYKTSDLIATYEELFHISPEERVTYYYGDYGGHFFKYGTAEESICAAYEKALAAIQMDSDTFQQSKDFIYRGGIIARMQSCTLGPDARLKDVLDRWPGSEFDQVVHREETDCRISALAFAKLTTVGQEDFAVLLDAKVEAIRAGSAGLEIMISGVEPQELERFRNAYDAHEQAERAMGPVMG